MADGHPYGVRRRDGRRAAICRPYGCGGALGSAVAEWDGGRSVIAPTGAEGEPYIIHCQFLIVHSQAIAGCGGT